MSGSDSELLTIEQISDAVVMTVVTRQMHSGLLAHIEREATAMCSRGLKRPVLLKMDQVEIISSVMMGAMLALFRKLRQRGLRVVLVGLSDHIRGTLELTQLDRMFEVFDSLEEAGSAMRRHARL